MENICKYPVIFVHGMFGWGDDEGINEYLPYWGANTCNIVKHYTDLGFTAYAASVGPASSAWDRACELYARLKGGVVDYGKIHSEKSMHKRYGRFYDKPLLENWDKDHKIHLVGHSFGGNTIRMLLHLLTYGAPEEVEGTEDNVSDLFKGGQGDLVASLVTICAPHNGTTTFMVAEKYKILPVVRFLVYNYMGIFGRSPAEGTMFDFHLEQYGMSDTPGKKDAYPLRRAKKMFRKGIDNVEYDMCPEGAKKLNKLMEITPDVYYFSYSYNCVTSNFTGNIHVPGNCDFKFLMGTSELVLIYNHFLRKGNTKNLKFEDYCNDGLVDVTAAMFPEDEPHTRFDKDNINPGVWNVMKTRTGDHGTPIGLLSDVDDTFALYDEIFGLLYEVEQKLNK